ncbi:transglycosylase SLT domain-containing protein [Parahaliea mediterranea]|uniref:transglycosylase SLT domain-containing protein n=1 Tax=Parahaliea mediterranea TaxID=651086 RepID=UPI000C0AB5D2|nr:transglycosylase SLT domain-containing protein [Parahaliea mediterranea]MAC35375.1 lytic transglycosylase [Haliea sp.]
MATSLSSPHWVVICLGWLVVSPSTADTALPPPAYQLAAHEAGVPSAVLYAIALQESGTDIRDRQVPWPWTLNVAGQPRRLATRDGACAELTTALETTPARRIDVGLGQINVGYHAHRVTHPCDLLDPYQNLAIAAAILREQHKTGEGWLHAVGRYHRPAGGEPAERYRRSIHQHLSRIHAGPAALTVSEEGLP